MKKFNLMTETQMEKANGGLIVAAIAIFGFTLASAAVGIGVGTHLTSQKQ